MSQWDNVDDSNGSTPNPNDGGGLRQFAESVQAENKMLKDRMATIEQQLTQQKVQSVFDSAGVPGAAALYQGDADPAKAQEWIDTLKGAFGSPVPTSQAPANPALTPEIQAQYQNLNSAGSQGTPLGTMETAQAGVYDATDLSGLISNFQNASRSAG